jgi:hypothetical protein
MKGRIVVAFAVLTLALACGKEPTAPGIAPVEVDPSKIISDGAHGGNKDFFFLPPMVPLPLHNPDFELGKFNNALRPSLKVVICELKSEPLDALPTTSTICNPSKPLVKTFAPGSVQLVNLPLRQNGWWTLFGLPADGFYYVLWDTRQANLILSKYYRIKVFIDGMQEPLGVADVDPMSSLRQWKYSLTGQVIQLVDDVMLPIPFRVERGALCEGGTTCNSVTVTNDNPNGDSYVIPVEGNNGSIAGVKLPDGWLSCPTGVTCPPRPANVVFTISQVNTGANDVAKGTQANPCHPGLPLQQFNSCFHFSTIPEITPYDAAGDQFGVFITVATCFVLADRIPLDPREPYVQLWASDIDELPHPLPSANADAIMPVHSEQNCGTNYDIVASNAGGVTGLASAGWRALKGGLGKMFGVKTAYAVDLGLGGITKKISNIGPALTAHIQTLDGLSTHTFNLHAGDGIGFYVRIVGTKVHNGGALTTGIGGLPVVFNVASGNGVLGDLPTRSGGTQIADTVLTSPFAIDTDLPGTEGWAQVTWWVPTVAGTYTLTAAGPATGNPVTFTANVAAAADLVVSSGAPVITPPTVSSSGGTVTLSPWTIRNQGGVFPLEGIIDNGFYLSNDAVITNTDTFLDGNHNSTELQEANAFFNWGGPTLTIPPRSPGIYYLGILVDQTNHVSETNETNNYVSQALTVVGPDETSIPWGATERRMLSMQTGSHYRLVPSSPVATWNTDAPSNVSLTVGELATVVNASVGGENISSGADAAITTTLDNGSPGPSALVNSFQFDLFPRITTLAWNPVSGAASYEVVTEYGNTCSVPAACTVWAEVAKELGGHTFTTGLTHTVDFVGAQPGRWHVIARDANAAVLDTSAWVYFAYLH